ncbi:MAG: transcriptional repressor [Gammaproteobacteria bacterium]|nr:transcriptional repressor [Gammaproteobacteria bacterium]
MDHHQVTSDAYSEQPAAPTLLATSTGRLTPARQTVIDILNATRQALTHHEIESQARANGVRFDRVTLYRALDWLVVQGIVHKVAAEDRVWRFNAIRSSNAEQAHFHCTRCGAVECLDHTETRLPIRTPAGYKVERSEIMLHGVCAACAN